MFNEEDNLYDKVPDKYRGIFLDSETELYCYYNLSEPTQDPLCVGRQEFQGQAFNKWACTLETRDKYEDVLNCNGNVDGDIIRLSRHRTRHTLVRSIDNSDRGADIQETEQHFSNAVKSRTPFYCFVNNKEELLTEENLLKCGDAQKMLVPSNNSNIPDMQHLFRFESFLDDMDNFALYTKHLRRRKLVELACRLRDPDLARQILETIGETGIKLSYVITRCYEDYAIGRPIYCDTTGNYGWGGDKLDTASDKFLDYFLSIFKNN